MFRLLLLFLVACGGSETGGYGSKPPSKPDSEKFVAVKPLIDKYCSNCHGQGKQQQGFPNESRWLSSLAKQKIESNQMPQGSVLDAQTKSQFLASFSN